MRLEDQFASAWAKRIVEREGLTFLLSMSRTERRAFLTGQIEALGAEPREVEQIIGQIEAIMSDHAKPADTVMARGSARMYR